MSFPPHSLSVLLCGTCSSVQSELDCLLPGGERVMVLLSGHSEMDSSAKSERVSRMYSMAENILPAPF